MTRHETFAATALQGLVAARTNLDIQGEIETAWRYADGMESVAKLRENINDVDSPGAREAARDALLKKGVHLEIVARERFADALMHGIAHAHDNGQELTENEEKNLAGILANFGTAVAATDERTYARCEISGFQGMCCTFTFHDRRRQSDREADRKPAPTPAPGQGRRQGVPVASERRRLLAIKAEIKAAYELELAELHSAYARHVARIDAQLRDLDHGLMPQPPREDHECART